MRVRICLNSIQIFSKVPVPVSPIVSDRHTRAFRWVLGRHFQRQVQPIGEQIETAEFSLRVDLSQVPAKSITYEHHAFVRGDSRCVQVVMPGHNDSGHHFTLEAQSRRTV